MENMQTPEGKLIGDAQKRLNISSRKAADEIGMSDTRWRNIVNGYQAVGRGEQIAVVAPAETLARMATVVGVTPEELAEAGRGDAAKEFKSLFGERHESGKASLARLLDMWLVREGMGPDKFARAVNPDNFRLVYAWRAGTSAPQKKNRAALEDVLGWRRGSVTEVLEAPDSVYWGLDRVEPTKEAQPLAEARELSTPDLVQELMRRVLEMEHELGARNEKSEPSNVRSLFGLAADKNGNAGQEDIDTD